MFARISGSLAGELVVDTPAGSETYPANVWIWSEQSIQAQRRRFKCPPFQSLHGSDGADPSSNHPRHRAALVCRAARRSKQMHSSQRRLHKHTTSQRAHGCSSICALRTSMLPDSSNCKGSLRTPVLQQQQQAAVDPEQLTACISAATCYHQLEALCNAFLHNASFSRHHAALVISRLHKVRGRAQDGQLLLVELLAAKLSVSATCSNARQQGLCPAEVAAVCWGFAKAGYQPDAGLLQQLLQQFWSGYEKQQHILTADMRHSNSVGEPAEALATLIAGIAGLGLRDGITWDRLRTSIEEQLPRLSSACLQQVVWGLATAQQSVASLTAALAAAVDAQLANFSAEDLVHVVWCLHVMGCRDLALFERASQQMSLKVGSQIAARGGSTSSTTRKQHLAQQQPRQQQQLREPPKNLSGQLLQSPQQQQQQQPKLSGTSGDMVAALCNAAATQAYSVLEKYDPLMSTLLLYKKLQPAHS